MIEHILRYVVPAGYSLLPPYMQAPAATAEILAAGLQESQFTFRRQKKGGPARGFFQFERDGGIAEVLENHATQAHIEDVLRALRYGYAIGDRAACHAAIEHNDTLAFVFARLRLWILPVKLPTRDDWLSGWNQYLRAWRPGQPKPDTWAANYTEAWERVEPSPETGVS